MVVTERAVAKAYLSAEDFAETPPGVVTVTSTLPADSAGLVAAIWVALFTVKLVAAVVPKSTAVAPVRLVPVTVTLVPPAEVPVVGLTAVTVGATTKVKSSAEDLAETPPGVVTVTSTVAAATAGLVTVIWVALFTVTPVPAVVPKSTAVAPVKAVPVTVTLVPPAVGPELGLTAVTVGAAALTKVY